MMRHYNFVEYTRMDTQTLLASDPVYWRTYSRVVEGDR